MTLPHKRRIEKSTAKQFREHELELTEFRKKCYVCRKWINLGERCYATGYPLPIHRHTTCARSIRAQQSPDEE